MTTSWAFRNEVLENSNTRCNLPVKSRCNRGSKTAASLGDGKILNVTSDATDVCFAKWIWFPLNQPIKSWKQVHAYFESHGYTCISYIIVYVLWQQIWTLKYFNNEMIFQKIHMMMSLFLVNFPNLHLYRSKYSVYS